VLGDQQLSTYSVLVQLNPDVICLGYDQAELEEDLRRWVGQKDVEIHRAKAHNKDTLHNSLLK
jgi:glycerol-3-phosphate cytidylyltransferase-like family protein